MEAVAATGAGPRSAAWQVDIAVAVAVAVEAGEEDVAGGRWVQAADLEKGQERTKIKDQITRAATFPTYFNFSNRAKDKFLLILSQKNIVGMKSLLILLARKSNFTGIRVLFHTSCSLASSLGGARRSILDPVRSCPDLLG